MKTLIFAILALVATAQATRDLSKIKAKRMYVTPRFPAIAPTVVGGTEAEPHSIPFQVAVLSFTLGFCGGSIIGNKTVLTAAHCVEDGQLVFVITGAHNIKKKEPSNQLIPSERIIVHENWNRSVYANDIALIFLSKEIRFDHTAKAVALNTDISSLEGTGAVVSGWGLSSDSATGVNDVLLYTNETIISNALCKLYFGNNVTANNVCMDGSNKKGACFGDSGGPLVIKSNDEPVQVGIVSFGNDDGCELGYPSVYTRVSSYIDWINQQLAIYN